LDKEAGIDQSSVSPGATEILCLMGKSQDFAQAADDARRIGNVPICRERLRQLVEAEASAVSQARDSGELAASWSAEDALVDPGGPTRIYVGTDGVLVRTVTQAEKDKRRQQQSIRRQQRSARGVGNATELPPTRPGSDQTFKEMKIGIFYDQQKAHRHAFATDGDHQMFGPLLKGYADQIGFDQATETISLTDGAKWIAARLCQFLLMLQAMLLDFYHLSQHVYDAAKCCLGDTPAAQQWARERLQEFKELGVTPVLAAIDLLMKKLRSEAKRKSLRLLRDYVVQRMEMVDYRSALARGWDIGSGPTEAMCKNLTLRLKRTGMKWDADHAADMMNLTALYESGQAKAYWTARAAA
jgi:hypothetical protein